LPIAAEARDAETPEVPELITPFRKAPGAATGG
jgi:hypothetical protein